MLVMSVEPVLDTDGDPDAEAELLDPVESPPVNPLISQPAVGMGKVKVAGRQARYC